MSGLKVCGLKPFDDCRQFVVPVIAQRPMMSLSPASPTATQVIFFPLGSEDCIA
jgi:hypothetical protein